MAELTSATDYDTRVENLRDGYLGEESRDFFFASDLDLNDGEDNEEFAWL